MGICNSKKQTATFINNSSLKQATNLLDDSTTIINQHQQSQHEIQQVAKKSSIFGGGGICMGQKQRLRKTPYINDGSMNDISMDEGLSKSNHERSRSSTQPPIHVTLNYQIIEKTKIQNQHFHNNNNNPGCSNTNYQDSFQASSSFNSPQKSQNNGSPQTNKKQQYYGKQLTVAQTLMSKYEYYSDIDPHSPDAHIQLMLIEREKRLHHTSLLTMLQYLNLNEIIIIGRINRKLYIVSGDISLLRNYTKKQQQTLPSSYKQMQHSARLQKMILRQSLELQKLLIEQQLWESQINNNNYVYSITDNNNNNNDYNNYHLNPQQQLQQQQFIQNVNQLNQDQQILKGETSLSSIISPNKKDEHNTNSQKNNNCATNEVQNLQINQQNSLNFLTNSSNNNLLNSQNNIQVVNSQADQQQTQNQEYFQQQNSILSFNNNNHYLQHNANNLQQQQQQQLYQQQNNYQFQNNNNNMYDIILDKNCSKIELQNQIFIIKNTNRIPYFHFDENNQTYKVSTFQSQQSQGSISIQEETKQNSTNKRKETSHLLIKDYDNQQSQQQLQHNNYDDSGNFDNVFTRAKRIEFEQMRSPENKKASSQARQKDGDQVPALKRLQTQDQHSIQSSNFLNNSMQHIKEGYYKHPKLSQESINYVQGHGYQYFKRINQDNLNRLYQSKGYDSSRFGNHNNNNNINLSYNHNNQVNKIVQSIEESKSNGGVIGGDLRVSNFSHKTPSFINRMRESSIRMMASGSHAGGMGYGGGGVFSNRNSNIMYQSDDGDNIYYGGMISEMQSNRGIGPGNGGIHHGVNSNRNIHHPSQNYTQMNDTLQNTNSNSRLRNSSIKAQSTLHINKGSNININLNLQNQQSIGSQRSMGRSTHNLSSHRNTSNTINTPGTTTAVGGIIQSTKHQQQDNILNIKLGHNTVVLLQAPDGTTATIMPINNNINNNSNNDINNNTISASNISQLQKIKGQKNTPKKIIEEQLDFSQQQQIQQNNNNNNNDIEQSNQNAIDQKHDE